MTLQLSITSIPCDNDMQLICDLIGLIEITALQFDQFVRTVDPGLIQSPNIDQAPTIPYFLE